MLKGNVEFIVKEDGYLQSFLLSNITNKSKNNIKSLLARGNISVDGSVVTKYNYPLKKGQKIIINNFKGTNKDSRLNILYEDKEIIVINKQPGLLSISTDKETNNTAYHFVREYVKSKNNKNKVFIVHRLDQHTSGILMFAKNEKFKHLIQNNWDEITLNRGYIAIVEGYLKEDKGTIESWLKQTNSLMVYSSNKKGDGKHAITHYKKIKSNNKYTLLDIKIDTGRKNQIRVHMKDIGHSIVGDKKYGSKINPIKRLGLHANLLEINHPITKKIMRFEAPIPEVFVKLFSIDK